MLLISYLFHFWQVPWHNQGVLGTKGSLQLLQHTLPCPVYHCPPRPEGALRFTRPCGGNTPPTHNPVTTACSHTASSKLNRLWDGNIPPTHSPFITASPSQLKTQQAVGRQHSTHTQPLHYCFTQPAQNSTGCGTATLHPHTAPSLLLALTQPAQNSTGCGTATLHPHTAPSLLLHPASSKLNRLWDGNTPFTHSPLTTACSHSASSKLNRLWDGNAPFTHSPLTTACSHSASSKLNRLWDGNTPFTHSPLTTACSHSASSKLNRLWDGNTPSTHSPLTTAHVHPHQLQFFRPLCCHQNHLLKPPKNTKHLTTWQRKNWIQQFFKACRLGVYWKTFLQQSYLKGFSKTDQKHALSPVTTQYFCLSNTIHMN